LSCLGAGWRRARRPACRPATFKPKKARERADREPRARARIQGCLRETRSLRDGAGTRPPGQRTSDPRAHVIRRGSTGRSLLSWKGSPSERGTGELQLPVWLRSSPSDTRAQPRLRWTRRARRLHKVAVGSSGRARDSARRRCTREAIDNKDGCCVSEHGGALGRAGLQGERHARLT